MKTTAKNLLNSYSFKGNGKYYTTEQGSRHYRNTIFGAFAKNNEDLFKVIETGNDAPRGGATGNFMIVEFSEEFLKAWKVLKAEKLERETRIQEAKESEKKQAEEYASLIETIEGEDYLTTAGRLGVAIGKRVESTIFNKAIKIVRRRNK